MMAAGKQESVGAYSLFLTQADGRSGDGGDSQTVLPIIASTCRTLGKVSHWMWFLFIMPQLLRIHQMKILSNLMFDIIGELGRLHKQDN